MARDLTVEFIIEPGDQAPGFRALHRAVADQRWIRGNFVQEFNNGVGIGDHAAVFQFQSR